MPERTLVERVEILEHNVEGLAGLPGRVDAVGLQIVQLREEMRAGFSALGADVDSNIRASRDSLRNELQTDIGVACDSVKSELRADIRTACDSLTSELQTEIRASRDSLKSELQTEIRSGDEETRRYMRVLHEEVISRIATIGEARPRRPKR